MLPAQELHLSSHHTEAGIKSCMTSMSEHSDVPRSQSAPARAAYRQEATERAAQRSRLQSLLDEAHELVLRLNTHTLSNNHFNAIWNLRLAAYDNNDGYRHNVAEQVIVERENEHAKTSSTISTLTETNAELVKQDRLLTETMITLNASPTLKANQHTPACVKKVIPAPLTTSTWTRSERLQPITPTRRPSKPLFPVRTPQSPTRRNHPSRLNIQVWPPIPLDERVMGQSVVDKVNHSLQEALAPPNIAIMSVLYFIAGNPIAIARPPAQPTTSILTRLSSPKPYSHASKMLKDVLIANISE